MQNQPERKRFHCSEGVTKLSSCSLRVGSAPWPFAIENASAIATHWRKAKAANPNYFEGVVHLVDAFEAADGTLNASLLRTDFKSYLYWREQGFPAAGVLDGFGSAVIRSNDGHLMLGRQRAGNVNGGLAYAPAGFIDAQDTDDDGFVHIERAAVREATEELGIDPDLLVREEGFYLTRSGVQLSMAVPLRAQMSTSEFMRRAEQHIAESDNPELEAVIPVASLRDVEDLPMPRYMRPLLEAIFAEG
jgi:8-oxo-dGTP pyrophosphatase MutT (NUDIX family)